MAPQAPNGVQPAGINTNAPLGKINNDYLYPRWTRPSMLPTLLQSGSTGLVRGWIYPMYSNKTQTGEAINGTPAGDNATTNQQSWQERWEAERQAVIAESGLVVSGTQHTPLGAQVVTRTENEAKLAKEIRYQEGKQFQFNPVAIDLAIELVDTAPPESLSESGNALTVMLGNVRTSVKMLFDRSLEVVAASNGITSVDGYAIDPIFKNIGVQKDIWDVFRIVLGGDAEYIKAAAAAFGNLNTFGTVEAGSATEMVTRIFDVGASAQAAYGRPVAVYYNANFIVFGIVTGMAMTYAEFNANYVPTKAAMELAIQVFNTTTQSNVDSTNATTDTTDTTDTGSSTENSSSSNHNNSSATNTNYSGGNHTSTNYSGGGSTTNNNSGGYGGSSGGSHSNYSGGV